MGRLDREPRPSAELLESTLQLVAEVDNMDGDVYTLAAAEFANAVTLEADNARLRELLSKEQDAARENVSRLRAENEDLRGLTVIRHGKSSAEQLAALLAEHIELKADRARLREERDLFRTAGEAAERRIVELVAGLEPKPCTCGSGGHPRACAQHPDRKALHALELSYEGLKDDLSPLLKAVRRLTADIRTRWQGIGGHVPPAMAEALGETEEALKPFEGE